MWIISDKVKEKAVIVHTMEECIAVLPSLSKGSLIIFDEIRSPTRPNRMNLGQIKHICRSRNIEFQLNRLNPARTFVESLREICRDRTLRIATIQNEIYRGTVIPFDEPYDEQSQIINSERQKCKICSELLEYEADLCCNCLEFINQILICRFLELHFFRGRIIGLFCKNYHATNDTVWFYFTWHSLTTIDRCFSCEYRRIHNGNYHFLQYGINHKQLELFVNAQNYIKNKTIIVEKENE